MKIDLSLSLFHIYQKKSLVKDSKVKNPEPSRIYFGSKGSAPGSPQTTLGQKLRNPVHPGSRGTLVLAPSWFHPVFLGFEISILIKI